MHFENHAQAKSDDLAKQTIIEIKKAALNKDIARLRVLLDTYKSLKISNYMRFLENINEFNWLLRNAAYNKSNDVAMIMIEFGADVNHFGKIIRNDDTDALGCFFVDMLVYYDNIELLKKIINKIDFNAYIITSQMIDNIRNEKINTSNYTFEQYEANYKDYKAYKTESESFVLNVCTRLFLLGKLCHWAIKNNYPAILDRIRTELSLRDHSQNVICNRDNMYHNILSLFSYRPYTTSYIIKHFEKASKHGAILRAGYLLQYLVDRLILLGIIVCFKNRTDLNDTIKQFAILLDCNNYQMHGINRMLTSVKWHKEHPIVIYSAIAAMTLLLFSAIPLAVAKSYLQIPAFALILPFIVMLMPRISLLILRPLTCRVYDVYENLDQVILSAHTSLLLADIAKPETKYCEVFFTRSRQQLKQRTSRVLSTSSVLTAMSSSDELESQIDTITASRSAIAQI
jgi:hypothetical protein